MEIDKLFGLPAHPLLVHVPVVLVPLAALMAIAFAIRPAWLDRFGWWLVAVSGVGAVGAGIDPAPLAGITLVTAGAVDGRLPVSTAVPVAVGASVEPMADDVEPIEPFWFLINAALWSARFGPLLPKWQDRLSPTLLAQMERGKAVTGTEVGRAQLLRTELYRKVQGWFERFDVILTPTLARTALPIEERMFEPIEIEGRATDTVRKAWYPYTHPFNLTGHPAISVPAGFHSDGLPIGVQLVGRRAEDALLLRLAARIEAAQPWSGRRPGI